MEDLRNKWAAKDGKFNVYRCLSHFVSNPTALIQMLHRTESIIAGDVPTQLLRGEVWEDSTMDIIVHGSSETSNEFVNFIRKDGYESIRSRGPAKTEPIPATSLFVQEQTYYKGTRNVHIRLMDQDYSIADVPRHCSTTAAMNAITGTHVVSFFLALFEKRRSW